MSEWWQSNQWWQPIESAPKDGSHVDVLADDVHVPHAFWGMTRMMNDEWMTTGGWWVVEDGKSRPLHGVTHWMPVKP